RVPLRMFSSIPSIHTREGFSRRYRLNIDARLGCQQFPVACPAWLTFPPAAPLPIAVTRRKTNVDGLGLPRSLPQGNYPAATVRLGCKQLPVAFPAWLTFPPDALLPIAVTRRKTNVAALSLPWSMRQVNSRAVSWRYGTQRMLPVLAPPLLRFPPQCRQRH